MKLPTSLTDSQRTLLAGSLLWIASGLSALVVYMRTLESFGDWSWFTVTAGIFTHLATGMAALAGFFRRDAPVVPVQEPVKELRVLNPGPLDAESSYADAESEPLDYTALRTELIRDEGLVDKVYVDTQGIKHAGIGHKLLPHEPEYVMDVGTTVSEERVQAWFVEDFRQAIEAARASVEDFDSHPVDVRKNLVNMAFNLGKDGLAEFKKMLGFINKGMYQEAADESLDSIWAKQVGDRALRLATRMRVADAVFIEV